MIRNKDNIENVNGVFVRAWKVLGGWVITALKKNLLLGRKYSEL